VHTATVRLEGDYEQHSHDFVETALVRSGTGRHVSDGGVHPLVPGSVVIVRPGSWHGYSACEDLVVTNCCFGSELVGRELAWLRGDPAVNRLLWTAPAAAGRAGTFLGLLSPGAARAGQEALDGLAGALEQPPHVKDVAALGWLLVLLPHLAEVTRGEPGQPEQPAPKAVVEAVRLLDDDPAYEWSVAALAAHVGVGSAHLTRMFTAHVGTPPMAYLSRLRAERAAALLCESGLAVAEVGRAAGWPDPSYFGRAFRRHYGMSPREYRRQRWPVS
jgi:AraC family L-rhamnose operon transcriptional activator RhaR